MLLRMAVKSHALGYNMMHAREIQGLPLEEPSGSGEKGRAYRYNMSRSK